MHQPGDKGVGILKVRKLPGRATQPEAGPSHLWQGHRSIYERSGGELREMRARLQADAKPLPLRRTVSKQRGFRLWSSHRQGSLALVPGHHQLAAALGNRQKRATALTMPAPDAFD